MSGMVFGVGSVVSFTPCTGWRAVYVGDGPLNVADGGPESLVIPVVGWAVVVTARDGWTVDTAMRAVVGTDAGPRVLVDPEDWELLENIEAKGSG